MEEINCVDLVNSLDEGKEISEKTKEGHRNGIKRILRECFKIKNCNAKFNPNIFNDYEKIIKYFDTVAELQTLKISVKMMVDFFSHPKYKNDEICAHYKQYSKSLFEKIRAKPETKTERLISKKEIEIISAECQKLYEEIKIKEKLTNKDMQHLQDWLVFHLYTDIPSQRNDFYNMKITKDNDPSINCVCLDQDKFYFNVYKTVKKYGARTLSIPTPLKEIITEYLRLRQKYFASHPPKTPTNQDYLLLAWGNGNIGNPLTRSGLQISYDHFNKCLEREQISIGVGTFRKFHVTNVLPEREVFEKMKQTARDMGHSVEVQQTYYNIKIEQILDK